MIDNPCVSAELVVPDSDAFQLSGNTGDVLSHELTDFSNGECTFSFEI